MVLMPAMSPAGTAIGLPIELMVEKKTWQSWPEVDAKTFRQHCRDYAARQVDGQRKDFIRLGIQGDWDKPYLTMDYSVEANIVRTLGRVIDRGHLHRGSKPVHWCLDCGSALAEAEVEYQDRESPAIDVLFRAVDNTEFEHAFTSNAGDGPVCAIIWTTTPWTLPANQAVALHPDFNYDLLQVQTEGGPLRLILEHSLAESALQRYQLEHSEILATVPGRALENLKLQHPFYDRHVPIILGDHGYHRSGHRSGAYRAGSWSG